MRQTVCKKYVVTALTKFDPLQKEYGDNVKATAVFQYRALIKNIQLKS